MEQSEDFEEYVFDPIAMILDAIETVDGYKRASDMMDGSIAARMAEDALFAQALRIANIVCKAIEGDPHYAEVFADVEYDVYSMREVALDCEDEPFFTARFIESVIPQIGMACLRESNPELVESYYRNGGL